MTPPHKTEALSKSVRDTSAKYEPRSVRTYTPSQAVIARSAGVFHWTPEGRRLFDFTSGVLVANLGHNLHSWLRRHGDYMGWADVEWDEKKDRETGRLSDAGYFSALPMTAYNAITQAETEASRRLVELLQKQPGGRRLEQVMWAASGSEGIQKALWAALAQDKQRDMIVATRFGFHGKKGLAAAVTGSESDSERDSRVRFISFPMNECIDVTLRDQPFESAPYEVELDLLQREFGRRLGTLITEPYLGGGGSYHPPLAYLQLLQRFCRDNDLIFILDEVQSNFGRTSSMFAFEAYELEPDVVVLGKSLGNGVPVAAVVGRADVFGKLEYGATSDTWSGNPLSCAAVLATLDEYQARDLLSHTRRVGKIIEAGLVRLKRFPFIAHVRGESHGMVWGLETCDFGDRSAADWAVAVVLACFLGDHNGAGIHLLGPLAHKVIRIAPPLVINDEEAESAMHLMEQLLASIARSF